MARVYRDEGSVCRVDTQIAGGMRRAATGPTRIKRGSIRAPEFSIGFPAKSRRPRRRAGPPWWKGERAEREKQIVATIPPEIDVSIA